MADQLDECKAPVLNNNHKYFVFEYDSFKQKAQRLKNLENMEPMWNYTRRDLYMMGVAILFFQMNMHNIRNFLLSLFIDPLKDFSEVPCANFLLGNGHLLEKTMFQRLWIPVFLYSLRLGMVYGCYSYRNGNKTLRYISETYFGGNFSFWYGMFMFCFSTISPQFCAYSIEFYSAFNAERLGHLLYEWHDIYSLMMTPQWIFQIHPCLYYLINVQLWGGMWESIAHEITGLGMTRESSLTLDTFHPGLIRGIVGLYIFFIKYGWEVNWAFIKKSSPQQWHYLIWRLFAGFGAFMSGFLGHYAEGYRSEYYGTPDLASQIRCESEFKKEIMDEYDDFASEVFNLHSEHNIGFSAYSLAFEHHHKDTYCQSACAKAFGK